MVCETVVLPAWDMDLVHSIPCPIVFGFPTPCSMEHWPPHQILCQMNSAICFSAAHKLQKHMPGDSKDPTDGSRMMHGFLSLKYHSPCLPDPGRHRERLQVELGLQSALVSVLQDQGKDRRLSSSTVRAQQQIKSCRMRRIMFIADDPPLQRRKKNAIMDTWKMAIAQLSLLHYQTFRAKE